MKRKENIEQKRERGKKMRKRRKSKSRSVLWPETTLTCSIQGVSSEPPDSLLLLCDTLYLQPPLDVFVLILNTNPNP